MKSIEYIKFIFGAAVLLTSCSKESNVQNLNDNGEIPITFATSKTELSASSRSKEVVDEGATDFGNYSIVAADRQAPATRVDANGFTDKDTIGIYMYYNYWFDAAANAESVILDDASLFVGATENILKPYKIWTFSTVGGHVPYTLRAIGYYPKSLNAELEDQTSNFSWEHHSAKDALVAYQNYHYTNDGLGDDATHAGSRFKAYIIETLDGKVALNFKHQLATLSFYIYQAANVSSTLTIKSIRVNYTCSKAYNFINSTSDINNIASCWSQTLVDKSDVLNVTKNGTLGKTIPTDPLEFDRGIFLPPYTTINSIEFSFDGESYTYTWHPHIANMMVKNYKIQFELDPSKFN